MFIISTNFNQTMFHFPPTKFSEFEFITPTFCLMHFRIHDLEIAGVELFSIII